MIVTFRPIKVWPEGWRQPRERRPNPFKSSYGRTLELLDFELDKLEAREATCQVAVETLEVRADGMLRQHAKVQHPGVILTIESGLHGPLIYPCDTFEGRWSADPPAWQTNLHAVALGLEALRKVDRYGIADRGQQYAGYRELGTGIALGARLHLTADEAARLIADAAILPGLPDRASAVRTATLELLDPSTRPEVLTRLYRAAARQMHPDHGGRPEDFKRLQEARGLLEAGQ